MFYIFLIPCVFSHPPIARVLVQLFYLTLMIKRLKNFSISYNFFSRFSLSIHKSIFIFTIQLVYFRLKRGKLSAGRATSFFFFFHARFSSPSFSVVKKRICIIWKYFITNWLIWRFDWIYNYGFLSLTKSLIKIHSHGTLAQFSRSQSWLIYFSSSFPFFFFFFFLQTTHDVFVRITIRISLFLLKVIHFFNPFSRYRKTSTNKNSRFSIEPPFDVLLSLRDQSYAHLSQRKKLFIRFADCTRVKLKYFPAWRINIEEKKKRTTFWPGSTISIFFESKHSW